MRSKLALSLTAVTLVFSATPAAVGDSVAASCQSTSRSVSVELDESRYPETTDHWQDAIRAGQPSLLHIDRDGADQNRDESLEGYPPSSTKDRDEYPPAVSEEGGRGASIRYIDPSDNRGSGSVMGNQLEPYCEGNPFRIVFVP